MSVGLLIRILPVSNKRLLSCDVQFKDMKLAGCQVVPLFNCQGLVRQVLVFSPRSRERWLIPWSPRMLWVPLLQPLRVGISQMRELEGGGTVGESLWYHVAPVEGVPSDVAVILAGQASNCAGMLPPKVARLYFRRDLSKLVWVGIAEKSGYSLGCWKPAWLIESPKPVASLPSRLRAAASPSRQRQGDWVLDPIWWR